MAFYRWVRALAAPNSVVLNLGAGPATKQTVRILKGEVARLIGVDVDPCVLENPELDEAYVYEPPAPLPFSQSTFDLAFSDFVLEHIADPLVFLREVRRVLKPGASYFFRTPNRFHYVGLAASATPHRLHRLIANRARGLAKEVHEPWPTYFRMNSRRRLRRLANVAAFSAIELTMYEPDPSYLVFHPLPFVAGVAYERLVNRFEVLAGMRGNIFGRFIR
ncbi:MAG: class I SAM-dependent methyltransferase [Candidatus Binataceae bacterium]